MAKRRMTSDSKNAAVREYLTGNASRDEVAKKYGISVQSLSNWLREFRAANGVVEERPGLKPADADDEVVRLRLENARLREKVRALLTLLEESP